WARERPPSPGPTNLMALKSPPGASHFHTSPNPPLPRGSISWYPRTGSAPGARVHGVEASAIVFTGRLLGGGRGECARSKKLPHESEPVQSGGRRRSAPPPRG